MREGGAGSTEDEQISNGMKRQRAEATEKQTDRDTMTKGQRQ